MKKLIMICTLLGLVMGCNFTGFLPEKSDRVIVTFDFGVELSGIITQLTEQDINVIGKLDLIAGVVCCLTTEQRIALTALLPVRYIEPDYNVYLLAPQAMATQNKEVLTAGEIVDWGCKRIRAPECWDITTGEGVKVGVIDTGIADDHPDLIGAVKGGVNIIDGGSYYDDNNHGTYVSTVLGARRNEVGFVGVAPDIYISAIIVLNKEGRGWSSDIVKGYQWALDKELSLVNLSLGSYSESKAMKEAMIRAGYQGLGTVCAAGNDGRVGIIYPARTAIAVCVGAIGTNCERAGWSNYGPALEANGVVAPGNWVLAGNKTGNWQRVKGTSIAAPYVTGILALLAERGWCIRQFLFEGASQPIPDEYCGHGLVDAKKTLDIMLEAARND